MLPSRSKHRPVHFYVEGGCYFISASTLHHQPLLADPVRREWFLALLLRVVEEVKAELVAWVILPDHYHAVIRIQERHTVARLQHRLHARSALQFNQEDR